MGSVPIRPAGFAQLTVLGIWLGVGLALSLPVGRASAFAERPVVSVYRTASCSCCKGWIEHIRAAGFRVNDQVVQDLAATKRSLGIPPELASCHSATVAGYRLEGHVPLAAIRKLLQQSPAVAGIGVPGMPLGSPGMESVRSEPYTVFSFTKAGALRPFLQVGA
ncbi:MAG: DUF411 domain-containing protein [Synechococcus sp.]|nr:DUF411 domain-containing protein [Synechococcus sp.]